MAKLSPFRLVMLPCAALFGCLLGACGPHSDWRIEKTCEDYCGRAVDCNDAVDYGDCVSDCIDTADQCDSDNDIEDALDILEDCSSESCNNHGACGSEAWIECVF